MILSGIWLTSNSNYLENKCLLESLILKNIKIQFFFHFSDASIAIKQSDLDFVFIEEEFDDKNSEDFERISKEIKCLWVIKISSIKTNKRKKSNSFYYKKISRPLVQQDFESLLFQILQFKLDHRKRQLSEQTEFYLIPESDTSHRVPILKVDSIISIRKTNYGILIQFKGCVSYNYKIDYELFNKLARGYSNFFEIVPDLLVNINNIESVVLDQKDEEYICNLVGEKNITLSLNQKEHLFSHISFFSNQFIQ